LREQMRRPAVAQRNRALQKQARSTDVTQVDQSFRALDKSLGRNHLRPIGRQRSNADGLGRSRRLALFRELHTVGGKARS
jgi:hypothetical protein